MQIASKVRRRFSKHAEDNFFSGEDRSQRKGINSDMIPSTDQRKGDWILLPSGTEFYVLDPRAEEIHISDIAHNLANNCRFHGSCCKHYSVAEHSLYVAYLLRNEPIVKLEKQCRQEQSFQS